MTEGRRAIGAGVVSGVLLWLASPAVGVWWLAWVALVPAAAVALNAPESRAGRLAMPLAVGVHLELTLVPALPFGIAEGQWGEPAVPLMVADSPVLAVALVAVPLFAGLLYLLRFGLPWLPGPVAAVLVPAASFAALDMLRAKFDPGGMFGPVFLSQAGSPGAGLAGTLGPWGLTFIIAAASYALALALVRARVPARRRAAALAPAAALAVAAVALPGAGAQGPAERLVVAAVQPGYDTAEEDRPELRFFERGTYGLAALDTIRDLGELTRRAAERGARVVVWPEAAVWVDPYEDGAVRDALARLARATAAAIVVPYFLPDERHGAAVVVARDGRLGRHQTKQRPMWFLGERGGNRRPPAPAPAAGVPLGALMGVDVQDPDVARELAAGGARVLASVTHDWPGLATQHRALAALQARAMGVPVVRADWRYGSAIYDADGDVLADAGDGLRRTVLTAEAATGRPRPYGAAAAAGGWAAAGGAAAAWLAGLVRRRRRSAA